MSKFWTTFGIEHLATFSVPSPPSCFHTKIQINRCSSEGTQISSEGTQIITHILLALFTFDIFSGTHASNAHSSTFRGMTQEFWSYSLRLCRFRSIAVRVPLNAGELSLVMNTEVLHRPTYCILYVVNEFLQVLLLFFLQLCCLVNIDPAVCSNSNNAIWLMVKISLPLPRPVWKALSICYTQIDSSH